MSVQAESWLHCARFIGDMLVLAEVTDPAIFLAVSLVNQCFFVAGCCFAKDLERRNRSETPANDDSNVGGNEKQAQQRDLSRALFVAVTRENLTTFKQGLAKQTKYWSGIGRIGINLEQRLAGVDDVDLLDVTDKLHTFVTLPGAELADLPHERPRSTLSGADRRLPTMDETIASSSVNRVLVEDGNNFDATSAYSSLRPFSSLWADPNLQALSQDTGQMYQILRDLGVEM